MVVAMLALACLATQAGAPAIDMAIISYPLAPCAGSPRDSGKGSLAACMSALAPVRKFYRRHCATEFLDFLKQIDGAMPAGPEVDLVTDNYSADTTSRIRAWLSVRPHWHPHFTPTSASWINQVECWFAELFQQQNAADRSGWDPAAIQSSCYNHADEPEPHYLVAPSRDRDFPQPPGHGCDHKPQTD